MDNGAFYVEDIKSRPDYNTLSLHSLYSYVEDLCEHYYVPPDGQDEQSRNVSVLLCKNTVFAIFLSLWLSFDQTARQTLYGFSKEPYLPVGTASRMKIKPKLNQADYTQLRRAKAAIKARGQLAKNQAIAEGRLPPDRNEDHQADDSADDSFLTLCGYELQRLGYLSVLELIDERKIPWSTTHAATKYNTLENALQSYYEIFEILLTGKHTHTDRQVNDEEYVVIAMRAMMLEQGYHIHFIVTLAYYLWSGGMPVNCLNTPHLAYLRDCLKSLLIRAQQIPDDPTYNRSSIIQEYQHYDIFCDVYRYLYPNSPEEFVSDFERYQAEICCMHDALFTLKHLRIASTLHSWRPEDYKDVRNFFAEHYRVGQIFKDAKTIKANMEKIKSTKNMPSLFPYIIHVADVLAHLNDNEEGIIPGSVPPHDEIRKAISDAKRTARGGQKSDTKQNT